MLGDAAEPVGVAVDEGVLAEVKVDRIMQGGCDVYAEQGLDRSDVYCVGKASGLVA